MGKPWPMGSTHTVLHGPAHGPAHGLIQLPSAIPPPCVGLAAAESSVARHVKKTRRCTQCLTTCSSVPALGNLNLTIWCPKPRFWNPKPPFGEPRFFFWSPKPPSRGPVGDQGELGRQKVVRRPLPSPPGMAIWGQLQQTNRKM